MTSKTYLAIAVLLVALLAAAFLAWPKYQNWGSLQLQIQLKEAELQSKTEYFDNIRAISQQLKDYQGQLQKITSALPSDPSLPATFNFLQRTAAQSGLIMEEVSVGRISELVQKETRASVGKREAPGKTSEQVSDVKVINLSMVLLGSYDSLKSFLSATENSTRIVEIKKVVLTPSDEDEELFSFDVDVVIHSY